MYGFLCCHKNLNVNRLIKRGWNNSIHCDDYQFWYHPLSKFEDDHLFFETEKYVILLDGVVFNITDLMNGANAHNWKECFLALIGRHGDRVADVLRGSFRSVIYDKESHRFLAFTNHTGEKTVYYTMYRNNIVFASHINIIKELSEMKNLEADIQSHYELLLTGSILAGKTPFMGINRITAGKYLVCQDSKIQLESYHVFYNVPENDLSLDECIEEADRLFRQAISRIFGKSREYGYKAECDLSGGLDSRFATWVAHDLGYDNVLNICYSVEGSLDHIISKQIAHNIGNDYYFLPMDAYVMGDIDKKTMLTGGQVLYMIGTGASHVLEKIDTKNIGICCTGLLGEMQNAYWTEGEEHTKASYISNRKSYYKDLELPQAIGKEYENYEQMNLYEYSYVLFLLSALVRQELVEVTSPFLDADYMDFIFRIPLKWRKNYYFSQAFMCKKYPQAAKYLWQGKRMPVDKHFQRKFYAPKVIDDMRNFSVKCANKAFRMLHINKQFYRKDDMNPIETWYRNNKEIRQYFEKYFRDGINYVANEELRRVLRDMWKDSPLATDKVQVVNVIAVWKNYIKKINR